MKTCRKTLAAALSAVSAGVSDQEVIEQTSSFAFVDGRVHSFNDEVSVSCPVDLDIEGAVSAKELTALVSRLKTDEVEFVVKGGELRLKSSRAKAGLRLESEILIPLDDMDIPTKWMKLPEDFCKGLKACMSSVSRDQSKPILMCIHIDDDSVESSDNARITRYTMDGSAFKSPVLIPAKTAKLLITNKPLSCGKSKGWLHFRNKQKLVFSCRYLDEQFVNIDNFITEDGVDVEFPDTLRDILDRASAINNGERVLVLLSKNLITIKAVGAAGWFEESAKVAYDEEPVGFEIEPEYLSQMIKMDADVILTAGTLEFSTDDSIHVVRVFSPSE